MKLRVRTLSNEEVEVEVAPEEGERVATLKEKIAEKWTHMPASRQRLVHAGKVLGDAQLLSSTSLKDGDRVVIMLTKGVAAPAAPAAATASPADASSSTAAPTGEAANPRGETASASSSAGTDAAAAAASGGTSPPAAAAAKAQEDAAAAGGETTAAGGTSAAAAAPESSALPAPLIGGEHAASTSSSSGHHTAAESVLQTGPQLEETLDQLVAMGFPRDRAEQAMRAAFNNPDRAVEYLMSGLPRDVSALLGVSGGLPSGGEDAAAAAIVEAMQQAEEGGESGDGQGDEEEEGEEEGEQQTGADTSNPLAALRRHPAFNQIRQMVQLITQNQDAFLEVLQQEEVQEAGAAAGQQAHGAADVGGGIIQVTRNEMEALQRLEALGFTRHQAVEAYLACDRNEEMAANFLLENVNDLESEGAGGGGGGGAAE